MNILALFAAGTRMSAATDDDGPSSAVLIVPVARLRQAIATAKSQAQAPLWDVVLPRRLSSEAGEEGTWLASAPVDQGDAPSCVAQVIPDAGASSSKGGKLRINLFHRNSYDEADGDRNGPTIRADVYNVLCSAIQSICCTDKSQSRIVLTFGTLDRYLVPLVRDTLLESPCLDQHNFFRTFRSECGMWTYEDDGQIHNLSTLADQSLALPKGVVIRPLTQNDDAELVNSNWEYKSDGSLDMIRKMIAAAEIKGGCVGVTVDGVGLVSWILRYLDGTIGMLFTDENYRRKGFAAAVVCGAICDIRMKSRQRSEDGVVDTVGERMISYIVDSNFASTRLYTKLGWKRVADADWAGFANRQTK